MALAGLLILIPSFYVLANSLTLFSAGGVGTALAVFVTALLAIPVAFGLGCLYLARRLQQGDRLARVLAIAVSLAVGAACILTSARDPGWVLVGLLALGVAAVLLFDRGVASHFVGEQAKHGGEPTPVVAARVLMVVVGCSVLLVGAVFLPLGIYVPSLIVYGVIDIAIAAGVFYLSRKVAGGDRTARVMTTGLALVYLVNSIIAGHGEPGVILPVGLALCVVGMLWGPESSRRYFDSLAPPRYPIVLVVERAIESAIVIVSNANLASREIIAAERPGTAVTHSSTASFVETGTGIVGKTSAMVEGAADDPPRDDQAPSLP